MFVCVALLSQMLYVKCLSALSCYLRCYMSNVCVRCLVISDLVYHEVLDIVNTFRKITNADIGGNAETKLSHHLSNRKIKEFGKNLNKMIRFMEVHGNPFCINKDDTKLKNFVTQIYATESVAGSFFPLKLPMSFKIISKMCTSIKQVWYQIESKSLTCYQLTIKIPRNLLTQKM